MTSPCSRWTRRFCLFVLIAAISSTAIVRSVMAAITVDQLSGEAVSGVGPHVQDLEDAIKKFGQGDLDAAKKLLESAKKSTPKLPPVQVMMANLLFSSGRNDLLGQARAELEKGVKDNPNDPEPLLIIGELALRDGRLTEAGLVLEKAVKSVAAFNENPVRKKKLQIRAFAAAALVEETLEDWKSAKEDLLAWIALDPDNAAAHQRLGRVLFKLESVTDAFKEYQAAAKADKNVAPAEIQIGMLYSQAGDKPNAEKFMNAAIKRGASDFRTQLTLSQWMLNTNQMKEALAHANEAVKLDGKNAEARITRGLILRAQKNFKGAEEDFEAVRSQSPSNAMAINQLALTLVEKPDEASQSRALEFAEMNARQNARNLEAGATLGWIYYKLGRRSEAEKVFNAIIQTGSTNSPDTMYYLANYLNDQGKPAEAQRLLNSALQGERLFAYRQQAEDLLRKISSKAKPKAAPAAAQGAKGDK